MNAAQTFALHSMPGASKVIFLDFDGAANTYQPWLDDGIPAQLRGFDPSNDGPTFNADELATIGQVWEVVADRFAPWDVDVTTEDPGPDALTRSDQADTTYGTHLIYTSPGTPDIGVKYGLNGVATGGFDSVDTPARAYVFPHDGWKVRDLADVGSHEIGHTLGLQHHQSTTLSDNYSGKMNGFGRPIYNWSPIMGALGTQLVQWSKGDFKNSNHAQDDLATIGQRLAVRTDEAPSDPNAAVPLTQTTDYITSSSDVDSYALGTCAAGAQVSVTPVVQGSSLDIDAALVQQGEATPTASSNPPSFYWWELGPSNTTIFHFDGLDASLTAGGGSNYVLQVRGGGNGTWQDDGYDAYGAVGGYTVTVSGCSGSNSGGASTTTPGAPTALATPHGGEPTSLSWAKPWNDGGSAITGYRLYRQAYSTLTMQSEGARTQVGSLIAADQFSTTFAAPPTGTYVYHLVAVNAQGESDDVTSEPIAYGPKVQVDSAPTMQSNSNRVGQTVTAGAPATTPSDAVLTYQWKRKISADSWQEIAGATGSTYVLTTDDIGHRISVTITAAAPGYRTSRSASLASVPVVSADSVDSGGFGEPSSAHFGTVATPDNNLRTGPNDLAIDNAGYVYAPFNGRSDGLWGNDRIRKFTSGGELVESWAVSPPGTLKGAVTSVDVGPDGNVYAFDSDNRQVLTYNSDGALLNQWTVPSVDPMILQDQQQGMTVDDAGNVYVADPVGGYIQKFDGAGNVLAKWGGGLGDVHGLRAVTSEGATTLYYVDSSGGVVKALNASTGASVGSWNGASGGGTQFSSPTDLAFDRAGNVYVLDRNRVQKFAPSFNFIDQYAVNSRAYGIEIGAGDQIYVAANFPAEEIQLVSHSDYAPTAPTAARGVPGPDPGQATLSWNAPTSTTAIPVESYTIALRLYGPASTTVKRTVPGNVTSLALSGLVPDGIYIFTIFATNGAGDSPEVSSDWIYMSDALPRIRPGVRGFSGVPKVGVKFSVVQDAWDPQDVTLTYKWYRDGSVLVSESPTYTPTALDLGKPLTLTIAAAKQGYRPSTLSMKSEPVAAGTITASGQRMSTTTPKVGSAVSAVRGTWAPSDVAVTYQWKVGSTVVSTKASYVPVAANVGKKLTLVMKASKAGYATKTVTLTSGLVGKGTLAQPSKVAVAGTYRVGKPLTVTFTGSWSSFATVTYQWFANGTPIRGAVGRSFTPPSTFLGKTLMVKVTAKAPGYTDVMKQVSGKRVTR